MAYDFKVRNPLAIVDTTTRDIAAGAAATVDVGTPTKGVDAAAASPWLGTIALMADGDGTTSQRFTGIAKSQSTDTAAAAGTVEVILPFPGIIYSGKAKTAANADTQAEVSALRGKRVVFDLTSSVWTIDSAAADAVVNTVVIVDGDFRTQELFFVVNRSYLDFIISA